MTQKLLAPLDALSSILERSALRLANRLADTLGTTPRRAAIALVAASALLLLTVTLAAAAGDDMVMTDGLVSLVAIVVVGRSTARHRPNHHQPTGSLWNRLWTGTLCLYLGVAIASSLLESGTEAAIEVAAALGFTSIYVLRAVNHATANITDTDRSQP